MWTLSFLILVCHVSSAVKHTLKYYTTGSSGLSSQPEFVIVALVDGVQAAYCDGRNKILEAKQDWGRKVFDNDPQLYQRYSVECFENQPNLFRDTLSNLKQRLNDSTDIHIFQSMEGCEWDESTGEVVGSVRYDYNGEDFMTFDVDSLTWVALKPQAFITKLSWDVQRDRIRYNEKFITQICPERLKTYLQYGESALQRTVPPSVSLLQKTPSSPISCHATGFYPDRAELFWMKDGEEIDEGVDKGEILPNHDGTFQINVDLDVSSVPEEEQKKFECVFHFKGSEDKIITKLDKTQIRTNRVKPDNLTVPVVSAIVILALVVTATGGGYMLYKKRKGRDDRTDPPETINLNPGS